MRQLLEWLMAVTQLKERLHEEGLDGVGSQMCVDALTETDLDEDAAVRHLIIRRSHTK